MCNCGLCNSLSLFPQTHVYSAMRQVDDVIDLKVREGEVGGGTGVWNMILSQWNPIIIVATFGNLFLPVIIFLLYLKTL